MFVNAKVNLFVTIHMLRNIACVTIAKDSTATQIKAEKRSKTMKGEFSN